MIVGEGWEGQGIRVKIHGSGLGIFASALGFGGLESYGKVGMGPSAVSDAWCLLWYQGKERLEM